MVQDRVDIELAGLPYGSMSLGTYGFLRRDKTSRHNLSVPLVKIT